MSSETQMKLSIEKAPQFLAARLRAKPTSSFEKARIAIVHYWFVNHRGGERVVEAMASMFPQADLFSLVVDTKLFRIHCANARSRRPFFKTTRRSSAGTGTFFHSTRWHWSNLT